MLPVKVRSSRTGNLLLTLSHIEEHGLVWLRPLEVKAFLDAVSWKNKEILFWSLEVEDLACYCTTMKINLSLH